MTATTVKARSLFPSASYNRSSTTHRRIPRIANKGLTFIGVRIVEGFLWTGKTKGDAKSFDRFVKNVAESNQRMFCSQKYIENFLAQGTLKLDTTIIKSDDPESESEP